jgi:hypothetical protein
LIQFASKIHCLFSRDEQSLITTTATSPWTMH